MAAAAPASPVAQSSDRQWPQWAELTCASNANLPNLLSLASASFERHTNWFLRHSDTGIRNLAAIIAAETAIVGLYFTHPVPKGAPLAIVCALLLITLAVVVAPSLCTLAIRSTTRAFKASMESVRLMAKCVWAMGLTSSVAVNETASDLPQYCGDRFLYPERWATETLTGSEVQFVERCIRNPNNSYALTKRTLQLICAVAILLGCGSALAIILS